MVIALLRSGFPPIADAIRSQKDHITELKAKIAEVLAVMPHSAAAAAASATAAAGARGAAPAGAIGALGALGKGSQQGNTGSTFAPFAPTTLSLDLPQVWLDLQLHPIFSSDTMQKGLLLHDRSDIITMK